jgi:hypothetical protein
MPPGNYGTERTFSPSPPTLVAADVRRLHLKDFKLAGNM